MDPLKHTFFFLQGERQLYSSKGRANFKRVGGGQPVCPADFGVRHIGLSP